MARIGLDARPLSEERMSGIPRLVLSTLESLSRIDSENEYLLYSHKPLRQLPAGDRFRPRTGSGRIWGSVWIQSALPSLLVRDKVDVFWGTQHVLPIWGAPAVSMVVTVHDLVPYLFPGTMRRRNLLLSRLLLPASLRRAQAIVTVSDSTRRDLLRFFSLKTPLVETVYAGLASTFARPPDRAGLAARLAADFGLSPPYLLGVGTLEPRKNIGTTLRAFALLAERIPHRLVLVGGRGWKSRGLLEEMEKGPWRDRLLYTGHVREDQLPDLYAGADVFLFPSLYEGFGSPLLEALACGVPVVTSNVSSLPEVAGDAGILIDPGRPQEMADAVMAILTDPERRQRMIVRGRERAAEFTWDKAAGRMVELFAELLRRRPGRRAG
jgi:glycosyltransferase involved in cell wall biosynthesis